MVAADDEPFTVTLNGALALLMVTPEAGLAATVSSEVATEKVVLPYRPAPGLVIPAMVRVPAVPLASAQDAPAKVTVTTWLVVDPVAVQPEKPLGRVIVGVAGTVKLAGNVTAMVLPAASLPLAEVVKPAVQVAVEFAVCGEPEKETLVGVVAVMVTPEAGLAATVS